MLPNKSGDTYQRFFELISDKVTRSPTHSTHDFEKGALNAISACFEDIILYIKFICPLNVFLPVNDVIEASQRQRVLDNEPRTNNSIVAWHKAFAAGLCKYPVYNKLIEQFRLEHQLK